MPHQGYKEKYRRRGGKYAPKIDVEGLKDATTVPIYHIHAAQ